MCDDCFYNSPVTVSVLRADTKKRKKKTEPENWLFFVKKLTVTVCRCTNWFVKRAGRRPLSISERNNSYPFRPATFYISFPCIFFPVLVLMFFVIMCFYLLPCCSSVVFCWGIFACHAILMPTASLHRKLPRIDIVCHELFLFIYLLKPFLSCPPRSDLTICYTFPSPLPFPPFPNCSQCCFQSSPSLRSAKSTAVLI